MTLFPMFDVPVFWPILLLYWLLLFTVTMKRQIKHMIKYKYLPFNTGKKVRLVWGFASPGTTAVRDALKLLLYSIVHCTRRLGIVDRMHS